MSLIYDALRVSSESGKTTPVYGSVSSGRASSVRRVGRAWGVGAAGVVLVAGLLFVLVRTGADALPAAESGQPEPIAKAAPAPAAAPALVQRAPAILPVARVAIVEPVRSEAAAVVKAAQARDQEASTQAIEAKKAAPEASGSRRNKEVPVVSTLREGEGVDAADALTRVNGMVARGEFDQAAALLDELNDRGLNPLAYAKMLGYLSLRAGRFQEARRAYEEVLARLPDDREAGLNIAIVDLSTGLAGEAEQRLRRLVELRPDDDRARALLAQARAQGGGR